MIETIDQFDKAITLFLNGLHVDWLDKPMLLISDPKISIPWFIFLFYLIYKKYNAKTVVLSMAGIGLVVLLCDRISVELFKNVFERLRPSHQPEVKDLIHTVIGWDGKNYNGGLFGFVSSHATNYFGIGMFFYLVLRPLKKRIWWIIFGWVIIVAYSRIYLGVHYLGDILGGTILGLVLGSVAYWVYAMAFKKLFVVKEKASGNDLLDN